MPDFGLLKSGDVDSRSGVNSDHMVMLPDNAIPTYIAVDDPRSYVWPWTPQTANPERLVESESKILLRILDLFLTNFSMSWFVDRYFVVAFALVGGFLALASDRLFVLASELVDGFFVVAVELGNYFFVARRWVRR